MASLSDQIDRLSRNTRSIAETAIAIAPPTSSTAFTRAVLSTHIGDLIRDIDPSELGLFRLAAPPSGSAYDGLPGATQDPEVRRVDFATATPLRKNTTRREDKHEIDPEVYAHAALKYIDRYEPIRPMPRAYDQIVTILNRLNAVRENIDVLSKELRKSESADKEPPTKTRIAEEERRMKELEARITELQKQKENASRPATKPVQMAPPKPAQPPKAPVTPGSPQEDKFWATKGEPSRTLHFSENLLDEEVNLGDVSSTSFGTPLGPLPRLKILGDLDDVSITQFLPREQNKLDDDDSPVSQKDSAVETETPPPLTPELPPRVVQPTAPPPPVETPTSRQRKVKLNIELDRIVAKIWVTVGDIIAPHLTASPLSVPDTIIYLEELAKQIPSPDSPITLSSASSAIADGIPPKPNAQQIQYAHMVMLLVSSAPHYSMPLNELKDHLAAKAKMAGGTSRVLFQCVAKRLVKIDRSSGEQIVKFDI